MQLQYEWMRCLPENVCLANGILQVVVLDEELFAQHFHGEWLLGFVCFEVDLKDLAERALAKNL